MKTLLIVGNDKVGKLALSKIDLTDSTEVAIDKSTNLKRIFRLVARRRISIILILKMFVCEFRRRKTEHPYAVHEIENNNDIINLLGRSDFHRIILFRAGLIVSKNLIESGVPIFNIHAARVPEYGGIGSIQRALDEKAHEQFASLHVVTTKIDEGRVVDQENFMLNPDENYCLNEDKAYQAAIRLLTRALQESYPV